MEQQQLDESFEDKSAFEVLQEWESRHTQPGFDPVPTLRRLADILQTELEIYMRNDPDPCHERRPHRLDATEFEIIVQHLFGMHVFLSKLSEDYLRDNYFTRQNIQKSSLELNILSCSILLVLLPDMDRTYIFKIEFDNLIRRLYSWANDGVEPLQSYATGLIAVAIQIKGIANTFGNRNSRLVPKMIERLQMFQTLYKRERESSQMLTANGIAQPNNITSLFANLRMNIDRTLPPWVSSSPPQLTQYVDADNNSLLVTASASHDYAAAANDTQPSVAPENLETLDTFATNSNVSTLMENTRAMFANNSDNYKKFYIPIYPPTLETSQMMILRYLTSISSDQRFVCHIFEKNVMQLIFGYIENLNSLDTCLAFEALKYLASLFYYKKFALDFIEYGGVEHLLKVPRTSVAATGVAVSLGHLAYSEGAMERISCMAKSKISQLVRYTIWLLGISYHSGKFHSASFLGQSFQFKVMLDEFDSQGGLRKLYNVISDLQILNPPNNADDIENDVGEDIVISSRRLVRFVCLAIKRYMESHLYYKHHQLMRQQYPTSSDYAQNITKASIMTLEQLSEQIRTLQENTSVRAQWAPVDQLFKLGGITLLFKIITFSSRWSKNDRIATLQSVLDVLSVCCVTPRVYPTFCDQFVVRFVDTTSGIHSILATASGEIMTNADVRKSALAVLCHCVCSPIARQSVNLTNRSGCTTKIKNSNRYSEELMQKVWSSVRISHGIFIFISLIHIKTPIMDADCIRGMACRALAGLARYEPVQQILTKLPLIANGQIQKLMSSPIFEGKVADHCQFRKYALELLECVTGPIINQSHSSLTNIHKANVVAQTKIKYDQLQVIKLIHGYLESQGLPHSAQVLAEEAGLHLQSANVNCDQSPVSIGRNPIQEVNQAISNNETTKAAVTSTCIDIEIDAARAIPIKFRKIEKSGMREATIGSGAIQKRSLQKEICSLPDENLVEVDGSTTSQSCNITLSTIVTEYLTNQHALCDKPMTTCPQFDLFTPHKCPDPQPNRILSTNINLAARLFKAQSGTNTQRLDRRFIHSNFDIWRTFRSNAMPITCCEFLPSTTLLVGTQNGEATAWNINTGIQQFSSNGHNCALDSIKANRLGQLVLTSSSRHSPLSMLWFIRDQEFVSRLRFDLEYYCEFSNVSQNKILGTQQIDTVIYDITTGDKVTTFRPSQPNQYKRNQATFSPTDDLVLSDGVLYDVRSGLEIHKFDKLNKLLSGVFHPNGVEVVANTEVWDLRTFQLLKTIPALDQCFVKFSPVNVIYGFNPEFGRRSHVDGHPKYDTCFKVLDDYDYSPISAIDVEHIISDLSVNNNGSMIALVENDSKFGFRPDAVVKIYEVGKKKSSNQRKDDDNNDGHDHDEHDSDDSEFSYEDDDDDDQDDDDDDDLNNDNDDDNRAIREIVARAREVHGRIGHQYNLRIFRGRNTARRSRPISSGYIGFAREGHNLEMEAMIREMHGIIGNVHSFRVRGRGRNSPGRGRGANGVPPFQHESNPRDDDNNLGGATHEETLPPRTIEIYLPNVPQNNFQYFRGRGRGRGRNFSRRARGATEGPPLHHASDARDDDNNLEGATHEETLPPGAREIHVPNGLQNNFQYFRGRGRGRGRHSSRRGRGTRRGRL